MDELKVLQPPQALQTVKADPLGQFLAGQLTERTKRAYQSDLREFFRTEHITPDNVRSVDFADIIEYRNDLAALGRKRTTINRKLSSLKAFFKMMVAAGVLDKNPADSALVKGFKVDDTVAGKAIQQASLQKIIKAIASEEDELTRCRDLAIIQLLTYGGLRRSEVSGISWDDLTQESAFYILRLPTTKSGVAQDIKLQPVVVHYLKAYRQALRSHGYEAESKVFISLSRNDSHGKPLTAQSINLIAHKYARKAGVSQRITAHMFRHTCCTLSIEGGAKPQQVQAHLRHKDLKTTMRYYENRERLTDNASDYIHIS